MNEVSQGEGFGQIFITDTNREHLDETVAGIDPSRRRLFEVSDGEFRTISLP